MSTMTGLRDGSVLLSAPFISEEYFDNEWIFAIIREDFL